MLSLSLKLLMAEKKADIKSLKSINSLFTGSSGLHEL